MRTDPDTKKKLLMTEDQAADFEAHWDEIYFVRRWARQLQITEADIRAHAEERNAPRRLHDAIWSILNARSLRARDLQSAKIAIFEMALFLYEEGKDPFPLLQKSAITELKYFRSTDVGDLVEILSSGACQSCKALAGKVLTIDEALETMPIPVAGCQNAVNKSGRGWCTCSYVLHFESS